MSRAFVQPPRSADARFDRRAMTLPPWITRYTGLKLTDREWASQGEISFQTSHRNGFTLRSARVRGARSLGSDEFQHAVISVYNLVLERLGSSGASHPIRFWNFLPSIHQDMGFDRDRYMVYNAGRFAAFETRYGGTKAFDRQVATASAIGHDHADLFVHCLSSQEPGEHLGNPRQIAPYRYSAKFGPLPPCFARATVAKMQEDRRMLLVGGTASIAGEESVHVEDLSAQFEETVTNLSSLIEVADSGHVRPLEAFRELRVYYPRSEDFEELQRRVREMVPHVAQPQILRADLCRRELLVEIEGVAELSVGA